MKKALTIAIGLIMACAVGYAIWQLPISDVRPATVALPTSETLILAGRVTDAASILSEAEEVALTARLAEFEARTKHQFVVVTVPTLNGQDVANYTLALANRWGIGRRVYKDGLVILVAPNERKVRIEVGLGLERVLPDAVCANVIDDEMLPKFKEGDIPAGINSGATALMSFFP